MGLHTPTVSPDYLLAHLDNNIILTQLHKRIQTYNFMRVTYTRSVDKQTQFPQTFDTQFRSYSYKGNGTATMKARTQNKQTTNAKRIEYNKCSMEGVDKQTPESVLGETAYTGIPQDTAQKVLTNRHLQNPFKRQLTQEYSNMQHKGR